MKIFEKKQNTIMLRYQISIYEIFYKKRQIFTIFMGGIPLKSIF